MSSSCNNYSGMYMKIREHDMIQYIIIHFIVIHIFYTLSMFIN